MTALAAPPTPSIRTGREGLADRVRSLTGLARRHWPLLVVLAVGAVLRTAVVVAYHPPFYFPDSRGYVLNSLRWVPNYIRPFGYPLFLKPFVPGPLGAIALTQHLLGLGLAAGAYAFLVRRGLARWLAAAAILPLVLDARQLAVEHYVTAETLFIVLAGAALMVLAWQDRLGAVAATVGGLLLGAATLTRSVGLPLVALALVYLVVRRVGWRPLVGFALALGLTLGGYLAWYHHTYGVYSFSQYQGRFLQARVLSIADCDRLKLTEKQRTMCPDTPPSKRAQRPDMYIWTDLGAAHRLYPRLEDDPFLNDFALTVIKQQPVDYALLVARETSWHFLAAPPVEEHGRCVIRSWLLPATPNVTCQATLYQVHSLGDKPYGHPEPATGLTTSLSRYSGVVMTPGPLLALGILVTLVAALWRPRRPGWRTAADGLLFTGAGLGLVVTSVATSMYEMRYLQPALLLIPLGVALAVHRMRSVRTVAPATTGPEPDTQAS